MASLDLTKIPKASDDEILSKVNQLFEVAKEDTDRLDKLFEQKVNETNAAMRDVKMALAVEMYLEGLVRGKSKEWVEGLFEGREMSLDACEKKSDILQRLAELFIPR